LSARVIFAAMSKLTLRLEGYEADARQLIASAQGLADERGTPEVEPLHLLYRLVEERESVQEAIRTSGVDPTDVLVEAEAEVRRLSKSGSSVSYLSPRMLDLLARAEGEASRAGGGKVSVADLLVATAQETTGAVRRVLRAVGLSAPILRAAAKKAHQDPIRGRKSGGEPDGDPLELYGRDLTRMAAQGQFDPVVGRDAELRRILQVLARRHENNPLLVGEAGVGRSSIVRALAMRMAKQDVPRMLRDRRLVALELGALVAGAKLRGQLEERMRKLLDAVRDAAGEVILVVPELAALVSDRGPSGAADLLGVALGRGEVRAVAVTSPEGMRKAFDESPGLGRNFVAIPVEEPTTDEAVAILRGLVSRFEIDHGVRIMDPALVAAVRFARRYVPGVRLPKAAIDLIDEAAARVRVEMESVPAELDAMERRVERLEIEAHSLEDDQDRESIEARAKIEAELQELRPKVAQLKDRWAAALSRMGEVRQLKEKLGAAQREYDQARAAEDHGKAGELRFGTLPALEKQLAEAEERAGEPGPDDDMVRDRVLEADVADVVAATTGVPVQRMLEGEAEKLLRMEERLGERVIGQGHAVALVAQAVRRARTGMRDPGKPIGSFLFLGPSGVGKTELAKALAEFLFDDEHSLTRLDMSEFMEKHMVARLLGSPPGYVDSDAGGYLTEAVRQKPYSVVLFDEMEKAHPDVFNILLQVLDDGRLTDSKGRLAHFGETVIIMTSNVGSHRILDHEGTADDLNEIMEQEMRSHFRPEFLGRVDERVIFDPLTHEDLRGIVDIQLRNLSRLLIDRRIDLQVSAAAKDQLVELGYEPAFGARPLKRVILKHLQDPLADALLRGGYKAGDSVFVDLSEDGGEGFTFTRNPSSD
jgi:ATP-dependent Clp protease ATP-binding subunit ClpB